MDTKAHTESNSGSNVFLTGTILFANLDYTGLADYAIKALIGGAIWFGYKLSADYFSRKKNEPPAPKGE